MINNTTYTESLNKAIYIAQAIAKEYGHASISPAHILKALLHKDIELIPILEGMGKDFFFMEDWAEVRIEEYPKSAKPVDEPMPDDKVNAVFIGVVAAALNSEDFVGVFVHFLEMGERSIEGGGSRHEIYGHGRPLDVESVQHVISFIVEF